MSAPTSARFAEFYRAASRAISNLDREMDQAEKSGGEPRNVPEPKSPFPWQVRLAERVCDPSNRWPQAIALPTAAGKTACIDVAVFALACQASLGAKRAAPRRIFFVVDRRIVVDQAHRHADKLSKVLAKATEGILHEVADALRDLAHPGWRKLNRAEQNQVRPLDVYALRGGMYRETAWARTPLQPTIIANTVDQVGSRLLFRGYGVSDSMKPIHAGLVGNDALILLDEAHCAKPFAQTMKAVEGYRRWADEGTPQQPFQFVSITATPSPDVPEAEIEKAKKDDENDTVLGKRIKASKPARLVIAEKAKGKKWRIELVKKIAEEARTLMAEARTLIGDKAPAIGIIVNRVATARELKKALESEEADVILLTGRMRPVDRDTLTREKLGPLFSGATEELERPTFVVATQCLEVGADLDFHALVTECASLDALRQRFGRLNRVAARSMAKAVIVIRADQTEDSNEDPVYGPSLAETWKWLRGDEAREEIDFGIASMREHTAALTEEDYNRLNAPAPDAPVLFPAHLDCWVQTSPIPTPDPDPAVFLHGPKSGLPDIQVVLRADLGEDPARWAEVVALCPPSSSEALPVRIDVFRRWLENDRAPDETGDVEGEPTGDQPGETTSRSALRWKGPRDKQTGIVVDPRAIRPGDTFVISITAEDLETLGDFPDFPKVPLQDCGDEAFQRSRDRGIIRITGPLIEQWHEALRSAVVKELASLTDLPEDEEAFKTNLEELIAELADSDIASEWMRTAAKELNVEKDRAVDLHPCGGIVIRTKKRLKQFDPTFLEDEESSESPYRREVELTEHSAGVTEFACRFAEGCGLPVELYSLAGKWHDLGKLDPRFQALLQGRSPRTIRKPPLAKSGFASSPDRPVHGYPRGGRHELLSVALIETKTADDLLLHLIATHHGHARPFAPPVKDVRSGEGQPFATELFGERFALDSYTQQPAEWNRMLPERFWRVVRRFGWWGSVYLETVFRLADHAQSRAEQERLETPPQDPGQVPFPPTAPAAPTLHSIELTGLDGSSPLAFLAALGVLRLADQSYEGRAKLRWRQREGRWQPVLEVPESDPKQLVAGLHRCLHRTAEEEAVKRAEKLHKDYRALLKKVGEARDVIKKRKLRGTQRAEAIKAEVEPLQRAADSARATWLRAREGAVPAPFLALGLSLKVQAEDFRTFCRLVAQRLDESSTNGLRSARQDADFAVAFGCESCFDHTTGFILPTEFELIKGSGHQFFLDTMAKLMGSITEEQLHRTVFGPWIYSDERLSFRWDPVDDRRYAYGWSDPSDDAVETEHGANLLAAFGLPLFPLIQVGTRAVTTGFDPKSDPPALTWSVWAHPFTVDVVRSLAASELLQESIPDRDSLRLFGVVEVFRTRKIEVGSGLNTKLNLTAAVAV